ncbi:hypothetical protein PILCRDRAFT_16645 [Piloderma croceum F 1598]|uniref:GED domain-containing protein n=1 Tax=Piloderma croceum (strain F 1598) TaxID=765440 RepID=A0A0C3B3L4_PILCF|nr:hypothetical protein PILCRDRAFT_16645 [Piloderma croceum F 1598]
MIDELRCYVEISDRRLLSDLVPRVSACVSAELCERSVTLKEEAEVEALLSEHLSEPEIKEALRKKKVQTLPTSMMKVLDEIL